MNWNKPENKKLIAAFLALKNNKEAELFLRDLMTSIEIEDFAKRLQTAELLLNKVSYLEIENITGFSSTTIARVSKWLNSGKDGYKTIISRINHHSNPQKRKGLS